MLIHKSYKFSRQSVILLILLMLLVLHTGCATPVGVQILDPRQADHKLASSVLTGEQLSAPTIQIINRLGLSEIFRKDRATAIATVHGHFIDNRATERDLLFALAETSFLHAVESKDRSYFLSAAVYAYAFLFQKQAPPMDYFEPRLRVAVDLYNRGIAKGFTPADDLQVTLEGGTYPLPFGTLNVRFNSDELRWGSYRLVKLIQATDLDVRGLRNRYRWAGIGAPLVASTKYTKGVDAPGFAFVPPGMKVPLTAILRFDDVENGLKTGKLDSALEVYTTDKAISVTIEGQRVPVEYELSSALAYTLEGSQMYKLELAGFLRGETNPLKKVARFKDGIFVTSPYKSGRIPVVLIHGTASSPARWAELINELNNDRQLWGHYQVWIFTYDTGNPILYSAGILAEGLKNALQEIDPEGKDPALRKMVLIGHSQGGLLARLMATESGTAFWSDSFAVPFEELKASPKVKEILRRSIIHSPVPFVKRVVFIATPHRGSYIAGGWIGHLATRFITLPAHFLDLGKDLAALPTEKGSALFSLRDIPRSTENMDPKNSFIRTLGILPISPEVKVNSIIAVNNLEDPRNEWCDGVVAYESAHLKDAESELVVHSGHSTQSEPATIEEIRRILIRHLREEEIQ